jgi:hypothetical protein
MRYRPGRQHKLAGEPILLLPLLPCWMRPEQCNTNDRSNDSGRCCGKQPQPASIRCDRSLLLLRSRYPAIFRTCSPAVAPGHEPFLQRLYGFSAGSADGVFVAWVCWASQVVHLELRTLDPCGRDGNRLHRLREVNCDRQRRLVLDEMSVSKNSNRR